MFKLYWCTICERHDLGSCVGYIGNTYDRNNEPKGTYLHIEKEHEERDVIDYGSSN